MLKRSRLYIAGCALALVSFNAGCKGAAPGGGAGGGRGGRGGAAAPVVTAIATRKDVPVEIAAIGNVEAYTTISVRSQVTGQLQQALFQEGDFVKKGDQLFSIDPRAFQAQLQQAEANLVRDKALVNQAEAALARDIANAEYQQLAASRNRELQQKGIVSKETSEQTRASADATAATVNADKAAIESARAQLVAQQAAVDNARVALSYTVIRSPINGRTGNLTVKVGNLVMANGPELMTIAQVEPVYVTFSIPAVHLPTVKRHMADNQLVVTAVPQDADAQPATGALTFVDNAVDMTTDTIKLKATFANPDRRLWPGQFARITLRLAMLTGAIVVPSQAVQTGQDGQYVFVVKQDSSVEQRPVKTAQRLEDAIVIESGLKTGEIVVTEGQLRLEPGAKVTTDVGGARGGRSGRAGRAGSGTRGQ